MFQELLSREIFAPELLIVLTILFVAFIFNRRHGRKTPPGPTGLPIVGYLPFLGSKSYIKLHELSKKYGPVYSLKMGSHNAVILCDYPSMKEAFFQDALMGRPRDFFFEMNKETADLGAVNDLPWKEHRRFSLHLLRDLGLGKSHMEAHIREEIEELLEMIEKEIEKPISLTDFLVKSTLNNVSSLVFGKRRKFDDPKRMELDRIMKENSQVFRKVAWLPFFPFLKKIVSCVPIGPVHQLNEGIKVFLRYIREEIKEHQEEFDSGNIKDFIDGYLVKIEKEKDNPDSKFRMPVLEDLLAAFMGAGGETIRLTLEWLFLIVATYPDIQKKVQQEIDEAIGKDRFPYRSDNHKMPFTEAVILETLRWKAFLPINLPRCAIADTQLNSYFIPKGTHVIAVNWSIHFDPKLWGDDVEHFKPERFLSDDGQKIRKPEFFLPFSIGKRACPGESLAYVELFMYFTATLQRFNLRLPEGAKPNFEPDFGIGFQPKPFKLCLERRK